MSVLIPELRADSNGKMVTRHVRDDRGRSNGGKNIPSPITGGNPVPIIMSALGKYVPAEALQRTLQGSSPRQQVAIRDAITRSNKEVAPLFAAAIHRGNNAAVVSALATVYERDLFTDKPTEGARFEAFMGAIRDAKLIGRCNNRMGSLAEESPSVQNDVKLYVYLTAASEQTLNAGIADLALRSEYDFEEVLEGVLESQSVDAEVVGAYLRGE